MWTEGVDVTTSADVSDRASGVDDVVDRITGCFGRSEPRRRAAAYLRGLLSRVERENGWQLAEEAGDRTPDGVQDFLLRTRWDADAVREDPQQYVVEQFGDGDAVLVLDETGSLKNDALHEVEGIDRHELAAVRGLADMVPRYFSTLSKTVKTQKAEAKAV